MKYAYSVSIFTFILVVNALFSVQPAFAATPITISGNISSDTTWQTGEIYVVEGELTVNPGIRLTVQPGVIVKFEQWASLTVNGELVVNGTSVGEVYFTSFNDDSVGGDTNGDGPSTSSPGYWAQLRFNSGSDSSINYATIRFGGNGYNVDGNIGVAGGTVNISNSTIASSSNHGISKVGGSATIQNNIIKDNIVGIYVSGHGSIAFNNNIFIDNSDVAGQFQYANWNTITSSGNTSSGIGKNAFFVYGAMFVDYTWTNELPYIVSATEIAPGVTLTVNQGAIIKFTDWSYIVVNGTLNANGTASLPIYFTSLKDDSVGGDTNKTGGTPASNDWGQIQFNQGSVGSMDHSVVRYGGSSWNVNSNIFVNGGTLAISNSVIASSSYFGLLKYGGSASITNSIIKDNGYGIVNASTVVIDARNNYWGNSSGPTYPLNPNGIGDSISDNVDFIPFLTSPPTFDSPPTTKEPVIIVPGIMGSYLNRVSGNKEEVWPSAFQLSTSFGDEHLNILKLDNDGMQIYGNEMNSPGIIKEASPIKINPFGWFTFYGDLVNNFETSGYMEGEDLIIFNYDWRMNIASLSLQLEKVVNDVSSTSPTGKVNIVAHSMGGLITKEYLKDTQNKPLKINKIVFAGMPQLGAIKVFNLLNYGDNLGIAVLNPDRAKEISKNMQSAYQLLPSRDYINEAGSYVEDYRSNQLKILNYDDTNTFMLSDPSLTDHRNPLLLTRADIFHQNLDSFIVNGPQVSNLIGCSIKTLSKVKLYDKGKADVELKIGDGTVPVASARHVFAVGQTNYYAKNINHSGLVSDDEAISAINSIIINGNAPDSTNISRQDSICISKKLFLFFTQSPVNLKVSDNDGNYVGLNPDGDVNIGISGSDFFKMGENNFLLVPEGSNYNVSISAYATGSFDFKIRTIDDSNTNDSAVFLNVPIDNNNLKADLNFIGQLSNLNLNIDTDGNGTTDQTIIPDVISTGLSDSVPPVIEIISPTTQSYERSSGVDISVNLGDSDSGISKYQYALDDKAIGANSIDLFFQKLGQHTFGVIAYDRAGNLSAKEVIFNIIATVNSTISDVNRSYNLGWIKLKKTRDSLIKKLEQINTPPRHSKGDPVIQFQEELELDHNKGLINDQAYGILKEDIEFIK